MEFIENYYSNLVCKAPGTGKPCDNKDWCLSCSTLKLKQIDRLRYLDEVLMDGYKQLQ